MKPDSKATFRVNSVEVISRSKNANKDKKSRSTYRGTSRGISTGRGTGRITHKQQPEEIDI